MTSRTKQELVLISILAAASLVTRIPLYSKYLYNWDSANFAFGLEQFEVARHQPHPPGYILYIALGRAINFFLGNPNSSLVIISILGSVLAVTSIYLVAGSIFNRATGVVASILLLFSPLAWFYGEVALSYMITLALVLAATWFLYQLFFYRRHAVAAAIAIGIAAGFRQDVLIFLGPFWLLGSFRVGHKSMLLSWLALAVTVTVWLAPLVYLEGGIERYRGLNSSQFESGVIPTSIFSSSGGDKPDLLVNNARQVWRGVVWLFGLASVMFIFLAGLVLTPGRLALDRRPLFLVLLLLPALSFFVLFHFGQPGYLLIYSAPLIILVSRALIILAEDFNAAFSRRNSAGEDSNGTAGISRAPSYVFLAIFLSLSALINTGLFIWGARTDLRIPTTAGTISSVYGSFSASGIRESGRQLEAALTAVRSFDPETTVVGSIYVHPPPYLYYPDWRRLSFYLPEYEVLMLMVTTSKEESYIDGNFTQVLLIGIEPGMTEAQLAPVQEIPGYSPIAIVAVPPGGVVDVKPYHFRRTVNDAGPAGLTTSVQVR